jgi:hypothetical protein
LEHELRVCNEQGYELWHAEDAEDAMVVIGTTLALFKDIYDRIIVTFTSCIPI